MGLALTGLNDSDRRAIAAELFTVYENMENPDRGELIGLCPIHNEKNPSFGYNYKKDVYFCQSCKASGDLIKLWITVKGLDDKQGFIDFCNTYGINTKDDGWNRPARKNRSRPDNTPDLDDIYKQMPPLPDSWIERLKTQRGWSREVIDALGLRLQTLYQAKKTKEIKPIRKPERIAIPIFDKAGHVKNIRLYKPGGDPKIISWGADYGSARLFPAGPNDQEPVLLCEGEPDMICAMSYGFNAITQTTKPRNWSAEQAAEFSGRDVVIAYDADQAGQSYADEFAAPALAKVARSVKILTWPEYMGRRADGTWPENHGEDLTDFFIKHRMTAEDLWELIDDADPVDILTYVSRQAMAFFERGVNDRLSFKPRLLAEKIMEDVQVLSDPDTGLIYKWNGQYWENYTIEHVENYALRLLGGESQKSRAQDAAYQVRTLSTLTHGRSVNDMAEWICVKNCMLNLKTDSVEPHRPDFYATYCLPVRFDPEDVKGCPRWLKFLSETIQTPEAIAQAQEFIGYCLTREVIHAKSLLLIGPGSDGKSVFLKVLRHLVGTENCSSVSFADLEDQFLRSSLYQKSVNISTEVGSKALESPYFKAITSGDPINAAFKHKNTFTFTPYAKLVFAANKLPRVLDNSDGYFRRVLPIKFKRQFMENDPDTDPRLEQKLLAELSGIFQWALGGLYRLWSQGHFTGCDETDAILLGYKRLNNPVICFVDDMCELDPDGQETKVELFAKYCEYCTKNKYKTFSKENFFRELSSAVSNLRSARPRIGGSRERVLQGIRISAVGE